MMKKSRVLNSIKFVLITIATSSLILFTLEMMVRILTDQQMIIRLKNDIPIRLEDPVVGSVLRPNTEAFMKIPETSATYKISSQGLRDHQIYSDLESEGTLRVLLLGDSFTFGAGVNYEQTWAFLLEKKLRQMKINVEIVKAGIGGYDTVSEALLMERLIPQYHPDMVIITFLANDLFTNYYEGNKNKTLNQEEAQRGATSIATMRKKPSLHLVRLLKRILFQNDLMYLKLYELTPRVQFFESPENDLLKEKLEHTKKAFRLAKTLTSYSGIQLVIFYIPQQYELIGSRHPHFVSRDVDIRLVERKISQFVRDLPADWISSFDALVKNVEEENEPLYFRVDGHLNEKGNQVVATRFAEELAHILRHQT